MSFWLIQQFTENSRCTTRLSTVMSTLSAKKASDMHGQWSLLTLHTHIRLSRSPVFVSNLIRWEPAVHWPHFVADIGKAYVHSATRVRLRKLQPTYVRKSHFKLNRAFGSIQGHSEQGVVIIYDNNDFINETYEEVATGKLQIRRFQPPHSGLTTVLWEKASNIYK